MTTTLAVYANADDALLLWSAAALADDCDGFAVQRKFNGETDWLDNFAPPGPQDHQQGRMHPSNERPFRRFSWTDHAVGPGDKVSYRVMPVRAGKPKSGEASKWSKARTIGAPGGAYTPYFNRGFVISQFMARYLAEHFPGMPLKDALPLFKDQLGMHENAIRKFLSGQLRDHVLEFVRGLAADEQLHGALYELKDEELEDALCALGPRAHIVLANGSIKKRKNETSAQARTRDQNKPARDKLDGHQVDVSGRFISPGALGHNKFLVAVGPNDHARRVWTGSTNWTTTGLCTQLNNGLLIEDEPVAAAYLEQWKALKQAGNEHPKTLTTSNGTPIAAGKLTAHFTRVSGKVDLAALEEIVRGANEGIHFLMFQPGGTGVVAAIREFAAAHPDRLARGVISTLPKGDEDEHTGTTTTVEVTLFGDPNDPDPAPRTFDVVQPQGFAHVAAGWAEEVTRAQFLDRGHGIGNAIIHSKVLVVDPFSDSPTVVTGSHNFSSTASTDNDENFVVIRGDKALAEAYIVNIESAWQHYAPRIGMRHRDKTGIDYLRALLADQAPERAFWRLA